MKRRHFLQQAGLLAAGSADAWAGGERSQREGEEERRGRFPRDSRRKSVLITSAHTNLARGLAAGLAPNYELRLTAPEPVDTAHEFVRCSLDHSELTAEVVRGVDAVVHVTEPSLHPRAPDAVDYATRCTYNLLQAAVNGGVKSIVYLSSLRMMGGYDEHFQVDEQWRPRPTPESGGLAEYLGEFTCREFARDGRIPVVVLRLADIVSGSPASEGGSPTAWVAPGDVARAVNSALSKLLDDGEARFGDWSVFHIVSHCPSGRFPTRKAQRILDDRPSSGGEEQ